MNVMRRARELGVKIAIADLGRWDEGALFAEYDARRKTIRVSGRHLLALRGPARRRFFMRAVAHELYHHLEYVGAVDRLPTRAERERAADRFARDAAP